MPHDDVTFTFGRKREPSFEILVERLQRQHLPRGEDFVVALSGSREERRSRSKSYLQRRS
jgi:hypothetical protein